MPKATPNSNETSVLKSTMLNSFKPVSSNSVAKPVAKEMLRIYLQHSEMLTKLEKADPPGLPEDFNCIDRASTKLIRNEERRANILKQMSPTTYHAREIKVSKLTVNNNDESVGDQSTKKDTPASDDSGFSEIIQEIPTSLNKKTQSKTALKPRDAAHEPSTSGNKRKAPHLKKLTKTESMSSCPVCDECFPTSVIQNHAALCGVEDLEIVDVTITKKSTRPERLAKTKARKRMRPMEDWGNTSSNTIRINPSSKDAECETMEVEIEVVEDDELIATNGSSSRQLSDQETHC